MLRSIIAESVTRLFPDNLHAAGEYQALYRFRSSCFSDDTRSVNIHSSVSSLDIGLFVHHVRSSSQMDYRIHALEFRAKTCAIEGVQEARVDARLLRLWIACYGSDRKPTAQQTGTYMLTNESAGTGDSYDRTREKSSSNC